MGTTTRGSPTATTTKRKDVWTTLLQISLRHALAEGRLHHRPHRAHHHRHRDHRQRSQVLTVCERGGLRGQRRLHRPHHQVLRPRRLLRDPLLRAPVYRSENETPVPSHLLDSHHSRLQHQVPLRLLRQRLDKLGGLGVHLLPALLHRRHLGGRRLHQGVRHHQRRCCPRLWCPASLQGLRRSFTISVTICQSYMPSKVLRTIINGISKKMFFSHAYGLQESSGYVYKSTT